MSPFIVKIHLGMLANDAISKFWGEKKTLITKHKCASD
jgi:hypothetical protein